MLEVHGDASDLDVEVTVVYDCGEVERAPLSDLGRIEWQSDDELADLAAALRRDPFGAWEGVGRG